MGGLDPPRSRVPYGRDELEAASAVGYRVRVVVVLVVIASAFGYFAFMAFDSATLFYLTVAELVERGPTREGESVRVSGRLVSDSFVREDGSTIARFELTDGVKTVSASHDGVIPDLFFNEHSEIILEGLYDSDGTFRSYHVTVKCPSKYMSSG